MSIRMKPDEDHDVVGGEFCSGFTDSFGKWNAGFYCPAAGNDMSDDVYCCGTSYLKYCCTKKEELQPEIPDLTLILGIVCGTIFAVTIIVIGSCFFCSFCLLYKRRHACVNGPLYQMHCSSTASGVANMYSFSNQNSSATTPIDTNGPHALAAELDYGHHQQRHHAAAGAMQVDASGRPVHSFAAVDLIPLNAPMGSGGDNDNPRDDDELNGENRGQVAEGEVEEDAPPPYEASLAPPQMVVVVPVSMPPSAVTSPVSPPPEVTIAAGLSSPKSSSCSSSTRSGSGSATGSGSGTSSSSSAATSTGRRSGSTPSGAATVGSPAADSAPVLTVVDTSSPHYSSNTPTLQSPESITEHESFGQIPLMTNNHHLTAESPVPTLPSSHSSHTSVNSGQAPTTPSSEETLYWSTKF